MVSVSPTFMANKSHPSWSWERPLPTGHSSKHNCLPPSDKTLVVQLHDKCSGPALCPSYGRAVTASLGVRLSEGWMLKVKPNQKYFNTVIYRNPKRSVCTQGCIIWWHVHFYCFFFNNLNFCGHREVRIMGMSKFTLAWTLTDVGSVISS